MLGGVRTAGGRALRRLDTQLGWVFRPAAAPILRAWEWLKPQITWFLGWTIQPPLQALGRVVVGVFCAFYVGLGVIWGAVRQLLVWVFCVLRQLGGVLRRGVLAILMVV